MRGDKMLQACAVVVRQYESYLIGIPEAAVNCQVVLVHCDCEITGRHDWLPLDATS